MAFRIFLQMTVLDEAWTALVTVAFQLCPRSDHLAVGVGSHNGRLGRVTIDPRELKVREDIPERDTRRHQPCRELRLSYRRAFLVLIFLIFQNFLFVTA